MTEIPMGAPGIPQAPGGLGGPGALGGPPGPGDEILVAFAGPADQSRLTVLVRIILAIPHLFVLWVLSIAAEVVALICWFAALFSGHLPEGLAGFQAGYLRWATRVSAYLFLLTDVYPPFELADAPYPVRLRVQPGALNRLAVLFRIILVIPAWIVSAVLAYGLSVPVMFVTWLIVLIAGRMPRPLHEALAAAVRYQARVTGYFLMLTARYPGGLFGDPATSAPGAGPGPAGGEAAAGPAGPDAAGVTGSSGSPGAPAGPWGRGARRRRQARAGASPGRISRRTGRPRTGRPRTGRLSRGMGRLSTGRLSTGGPVSRPPGTVPPLRR